jgi:hypothetical protein
MANIKLNGEEKLDLRELIGHPGLKACLKMMEACVEDMERRVITIPLKSEQNNELIFAKARAEGARQLAANMNLLLQELAKKPKA